MRTGIRTASVLTAERMKFTSPRSEEQSERQRCEHENGQFTQQHGGHLALG